jgi:DNA-binding NtrC family response regulator
MVKHILARHSERLGRPVPRVSADVLEGLAAYEFPGNVRELSHIVERAMLLAREGVVTAADLPQEVTRSATTAAAAGTGSLADDWPALAVLERRYIDRVLARTGGNKTRAAEVLGIDRRTLNRMFARERAAAAGRGSDADVDAELAKMEEEDEP